MPAFVRLATLIVSVGAFLSVGAWPTAARADQPRCPGGELYIVDDQPPGPAGPPVCPLKGTDVAADVTGMFARVRVTQVFRNPLDRKIEAIYTFPLPADAAVDEMIMTVGARRVIGQVRPREEARAVYESAKAAGHVASLLDQERPNIFTQSVANIDPGAEVTIEISYVEVLKYDAGLYEWSFPMVVGPRYIPGGGSAPAPMTNATPTPQVPDANRISPPVTPPGTRAGHDIRVTVHIEGGMGLFDLKSELHEVDVAARDAQTASVSLKNKAEIPNRDFVLRYRLGGDQISDAFLAQRDPRGDFFTLILQPPRRVSNEAAVARELVFVLDTSGSMSGFPIEKAKAVMAKAIDALRPGDTFNLITFAGSTKVLWEHPRPATNENRAAAQESLASRKGGGGTEMMKAIDAALNTGVISVEQAFRELRG
ncbi:MAG: VIT domain-containing protein, partial [Phycisphaerae bacterium]